MKFIATTSDKIAGINIISGQLIFSRDDRVIYLDSDVRTEYRSFILLTTEAQRQSISPLNAFYFVEETAILWRYSTTKGWEQLTKTVDNKLMFYNDESELPRTGRENVLYCTPTQHYSWSDTLNTYTRIGAEYWQPIA